MDFQKMTVRDIEEYLRRHNPDESKLLELQNDGRTGVRLALERYLARRDKVRQELSRIDRMLEFEKKAWEKGYTYIAGVDEAGRGPLAGPVVAAAVILPRDACIPGINDSKQLSPRTRETLYREITDKALAWSVGVGEVVEIDAFNILQATKMAMKRALATLPVKPDLVIIDALELEGIDCPQQAIVGGDRLSLSVAAASIVAKVTRDRWMCEMDKVFPGYNFAAHKGYATAEHRRVLKEMGPTPIHRKTFLGEWI